MNIRTGVVFDRYWERVAQDANHDLYEERQQEHWRAYQEHLRAAKTKTVAEYCDRLQKDKTSRGRPVTPEELEKMVELYGRGYSITRIAGELGRSKGFVSNHLGALG